MTTASLLFAITVSSNSHSFTSVHSRAEKLPDQRGTFFLTTRKSTNLSFIPIAKWATVERRTPPCTPPR